MSDGPGHHEGQGPISEPNRETNESTPPTSEDHSTLRHPVSPPETTGTESDTEPTVEHAPTPYQEAAQQRASEVREAIEGGDKNEAIRRAFADSANEIQAKALMEAADIIGEKDTLSPEDEDKLVAHLSKADIKGQQFEALSELSSLTPEARERVKARLQAMTAEEEEAENDAQPSEKEQRVADLQAHANEALQMGEERAAEIAADAAKLAAEGKHKEAAHKEHEHSALQHKLEHLKHWLHPEDPAKTWALRAGKTLYVLFLTLIVALMWEMAMINKMAGKR